MKTTERVQRNGNAKPVPSQVQIPADLKAADARINDSLNELEQAKLEAVTLLHLLCDSMDYHNSNGHWTVEFGDRMSAGIAGLVNRASEWLDRTYDETRSAIRPESDEAALT
jgi:hypothetical protein